MIEAIPVEALLCDALSKPFVFKPWNPTALVEGVRDDTLVVRTLQIGNCWGGSCNGLLDTCLLSYTCTRARKHASTHAPPTWGDRTTHAPLLRCGNDSPRACDAASRGPKTTTRGHGASASGSRRAGARCRINKPEERLRARPLISLAPTPRSVSTTPHAASRCAIRPCVLRATTFRPRAPREPLQGRRPPDSAPRHKGRRIACAAWCAQHAGDNEQARSMRRQGIEIGDLGRHVGSQSPTACRARRHLELDNTAVNA